MLRTCRICNEEKPTEAFNKKGAYLQSYCKECQRAYTRQHYARNKEAYKARAVAHNKEVDELFRKLKSERKNRPCMDCGKTYPPYVMDFDHRDGLTKCYTLAATNHAVGRATLEAEMEKCDVVCANCHRIRTHNRKVVNTPVS